MSLVQLPDEVIAPERLGAVHLVGVGGAGMSGIARILLARGFTVSGSDAKDSRVLAALRALGARISVGHDAANLSGADTVVVSTAIRASNPELAGAHRLGLLVLPRAAALASLMVGRRAIAVAGTHGKTTTTSMLTVALQHAGLDPSFAIGGELNESGANAHDGTGDLFVAEADESDGSFLAYRPAGAVVTNVEADHLDAYGTVEAYRAGFDSFVRRIAPTGFLVSCADDPGARWVAQTAGRAGLRVLSYGQAEDADIRLEQMYADPAGAGATVVGRGRRLGALQLRVPGRHNVLNAAAALAAGLELGIGFATMREGLAGFSGTRRRMELKGEAGGVRVIDSYAHHPTELTADLRAAREISGSGRLVVAFQPHLFSRTRLFATEFGVALGLADEVVVMEVYGAREDPEPGVSGALVAAAVPLPAGRVVFEPSWSAVPGRLAERARPGDLVLTLGAGDVTMIGPQVLALLAGESR